jgi:hypothetical protein
MSSLDEQLDALTAGVPPQLEDVPPALTPASFAERLYAMLAPLAQVDAENGWSLLIYVNAIGQMFQLIEDLVRDSDAGPGWSLLLDLDRCPDEALPWLAQFVGVRVPSNLTPDQQRAYIASTAGFRRGTLAALRGAAAATLTGARTVHITERSGDPAHKPEYAYYLDVTTYDSQTPNAAATQAALLSQKPGGLVLRYASVPGQTWAQLKASGRTWAQVKSDYPTWDDVRADQPA